jgi:UDP-N-acetylglucosamine 4,6-dehydratase/5-epimerase
MKTYLVTGAAGSLGREIVDILIQNGHKVRAMDINEAGLAALKYPTDIFTHIYGDIRDYTRVHYAMQGCDYVIHTAAMKNLDITEGDVPELNLTNVKGTENVAKAAIECSVECAILISTDKAVSPLSAYGASKLLAEEVWKWAGRTQSKTRFAIFRSGNFKQSAGNVLEVWDKQYKAGQPLTITDARMERYFIDTRLAAELVCDMPGWVKNSDIVIPKMTKMNMLDLMFATYPDAKYVTTGSRSGEKLEEHLKTENERIVMETDRVMVVS